MINRNQLIERFVGNLVNAVVHKILEKAIEKEIPEIASKYKKEILNIENSINCSPLFQNSLSGEFQK